MKKSDKSILSARFEIVGSLNSSNGTGSSNKLTTATTSGNCRKISSYNTKLKKNQKKVVIVKQLELFIEIPRTLRVAHEKQLWGSCCFSATITLKLCYGNIIGRINHIS